MVAILVELGDLEKGCVDCPMNQQSQKCKAGYLRKAMSVFRRNDVRYHRAEICKRAVVPRECRTCFYHQALTPANWCHWYKHYEEAVSNCVKLDYKRHLFVTKDAVMLDQLEELDIYK